MKPTTLDRLPACSQADEVRGDRVPRMAGAEHPTTEHHLESPGHDEQLLVPLQGAPDPGRQGGTGSDLRAPSYAGRAAGGLDGQGRRRHGCQGAADEGAPLFLAGVLLAVVVEGT